MQIAHGGGCDSSRIRSNTASSPNGSRPALRPHPPKDKEVVSLQVEPKQATLAIGGETQLKVTARYSDDSTADVTRWVKYNSNNEGVATVDDSGTSKDERLRRGAVTLWYSSRVLYATMTSPYPNQVPAEAYTQVSAKELHRRSRAREVEEPEHPAVR